MFTINFKRSINYLASQQQPDGSFLSLSSTDSEDFTKHRLYHSSFPAALICLALNSLKQPVVEKIQQKAIKFLLSQKSGYWSFNYWVRNSKESKQMPFPDDLDDTFCALTAIWQSQPKLIDAAALAKIVSLLTATEEKVGGPYLTWLVDKKADQIWHDVDLAVNSNIAYFLHLQDIELPNLNFFISANITKKRLTSAYYPSIYPIIYFISRFIKGKQAGYIQKLLLQKRKSNGSWDNPLSTALSVCALLNLGTHISKLKTSLDYLIVEQKNGLWKPYGFYQDPSLNGQTYFAGSSALTTAFCLEAINKYLIASYKSKKESWANESAKERKLSNQIISQVKTRFSLLDQDLQIQSHKTLDHILKIDQKIPIILMPYYFKRALGENGKEIKEEFLIKLGMANLYGWMAYTIYDDFLDCEGDPKVLSLANIALRELTLIFENILPKENDFSTLFKKILDKIDEANTWEVTHCRFKITSGKIDLDQIIIPDYGRMERLAQRSLGHALGPIAILCALGYQENSLEIKNLWKFFHHFIIAKQLNDDAHDWEKDLKIGQINPVAALLLKRVKQDSYKLSVFINKLREIFWYEVISDICEMVFFHTRKARLDLKQCQVVVDHSLLDQMLKKYEQSARKTLIERQDAHKFLKTYQSSAI